MACTSSGGCAPRQACIHGICQSDPCVTQAITCVDGSSCRVRCVPITDPCAGVQCGHHQTCVLGVCVAGCFSAPCTGINCSAGQFCDPEMNRCRALTPCEAECGAGFACEQDCIPIGPCDSISCDANDYCDNGVCMPNPCATAGCRPDQSCANGVCMDTCPCEPTCPSSGCGTDDGCGGTCGCPNPDERCDTTTHTCCDNSCPAALTCGQTSTNACGATCLGTACPPNYNCTGATCTPASACPSGVDNCGGPGAGGGTCYTCANPAATCRVTNGVGSCCASRCPTGIDQSLPCGETAPDNCGGTCAGAQCPGGGECTAGSCCDATCPSTAFCGEATGCSDIDCYGTCAPGSPCATDVSNPRHHYCTRPLCASCTCTQHCDPSTGTCVQNTCSAGESYCGCSCCRTDSCVSGVCTAPG